MRLSIFANHVATIMSSNAPDKFTLHPCEGVRVEVVIKHREVELTDPVWDEVTINGRYCGNRCGGVEAFTKLVNDVKPDIEWS